MALERRKQAQQLRPRPTPQRQTTHQSPLHIIRRDSTNKFQCKHSANPTPYQLLFAKTPPPDDHRISIVASNSRQEKALGNCSPALEIWISLLTLTALEIVLGVDNVIFISIMVGKLPLEKRKTAMRLGLSLAMLTRIGLLFSLSFLIGLTAPLIEIFQQQLSGRDLILIVGGLFLLGKSTQEIHQKLEGGKESSAGRRASSYLSVIIQIMLLDIVFSIDSVITAIGLAEELSVMVSAIIIAVGVMLVSAQAISALVHDHPTIKMLALSFLLLIGVSLVGEGFDQHIPKGYIYFAMAFSVLSK